MEQYYIYRVPERGTPVIIARIRRDPRAITQLTLQDPYTGWKKVHTVPNLLAGLARIAMATPTQWWEEFVKRLNPPKARATTFKNVIDEIKQQGVLDENLKEFLYVIAGDNRWWQWNLPGVIESSVIYYFNSLIGEEGSEGVYGDKGEVELWEEARAEGWESTDFAIVTNVRNLLLSKLWKEYGSKLKARLDKIKDWNDFFKLVWEYADYFADLVHGDMLDEILDEIEVEVTIESPEGVERTFTGTIPNVVKRIKSWISRFTKHPRKEGLESLKDKRSKGIYG